MSVVHRMLGFGGYFFIFIGIRDDMFQIDKQMLSDINALDRSASSLFSLFDKMLTLGGRDVLYDCFRYPLCDIFESDSHIELGHLETGANDEKGVEFTYSLVPGVAKEQLGMWVLEREQVFDTFRSAQK